MHVTLSGGFLTYKGHKMISAIRGAISEEEIFALESFAAEMQEQGFSDYETAKALSEMNREDLT